MAESFYFAEVGFSFVGMRGDGDAGEAGVKDEGDGLAFGVAARQGDGPQPLDLRPRLLGDRSAVPGSVVEV